MIVLLWLMAAAAIVAGVALRLAVHLQSDFWTTLWESGPLVVAERLLNDEPLYGSTSTPPIHVAVYGPLYYRLLATVGGLFDADRIELISIGRWTSIISLAVAGFASMIMVRRSAAPWWTCLLGWLGLALLTPTAVRFCGSTRPDAPAVALSLLGLAFGLSRSRFQIAIGMICLAAATLVKQNAVAAPVALVLATVGQPALRRQSAIVAAGWFLTALAVLGVENLVSHQMLERHWSMLLSAPKSWAYAWEMLIEPTPAHEVWMMMAWAGIVALLSRSVMKGFQAPNPPLPVKVMGDPGAMAPLPHNHAEFVWRTAWIYFVVSLLLALGSAVGQGSDQNYLIEPALAMGPLIGVWAGRVSIYLWQSPRRDLVFRGAGIVRLLLIIMLFNPLVLRVNDYYFNPAREVQTENALNGYGEEAPQWLAALPQPALSMDPWLAYLSGGDVWINDTVAYGWAVTAGSGAVMHQGPDRVDGLTQLVREQHFTNVVLPFPLENADHKLHNDIPLLWPTFASAVEGHYQLAETYGRWYRYEVKTNAERGTRNAEQETKIERKQ